MLMGIGLIGFGETAEAQNVCRPASEIAGRYQPINVQFDTGSTAINAVDRQRIAEMAKVAKAAKIQQICIRGFADKQGDPAANKRLSLARAEAVAQEFGKHGITRDYLAIDSSGEPGGSLFGSFQSGAQADRRVEIRIAR
jgi:outer membrane protein OmpA-like peptidoglycan-associated protein